MLRTALLMLALILAQPQANANTTPSCAKYVPGTLLQVDATALSLRAKPDRAAERLASLPDNTIVTVQPDDTPAVLEQIESRDGRWVRIEAGAQAGYVFDAYLKPVPYTEQPKLDRLCIPGRRVGPITDTTTLDELKQTFGAANVIAGEIPLGEGFTEPGTIIFQGDPAREIFVAWDVPNVAPSRVHINGTQWRTPEGIGIGLPLAELVTANKGPVSFWGFGWDYGGLLSGWNGGALEKDRPVVGKLSIRLVPDANADLGALIGDSEFTSDHPGAPNLNIHIGDMVIKLTD